jgi:hypothetical protein
MSFEIVAERESETVRTKRNSSLIAIANARVWVSEGWSVTIIVGDEAAPVSVQECAPVLVQECAPVLVQECAPSLAYAPAAISAGSIKSLAFRRRC